MKIEFRLEAKGIGDAVCGVYAACGLGNRGHQVTFYTQHWEWLQDFKNINVTIRGNDPSVFNANTGYQDQLEAARTKTCRSRASWYLRNIQSNWPLIRNEVKPVLPGEILPAQRPEDIEGDYILLAPFSAHQEREWSIQHWRILARALLNEGYQVIVIGSNADAVRMREAFSKTGVRYFWGQTPRWAVNAIRSSLLVIGNDSGPAHLAGLHKHPAIALAGQIDADFVFRDSPTVHSILPPESVPCRLCHWKEEGGYHWVCNTGCSALQLISPFDVVDKALSIIQGTKNESIECQTGEREAGLQGTRIPGVQQTSECSEGQREEEDGAGQEGGGSEAGEVRPEGLRGLHAAQGPRATLKLPKKERRNQGQERKAHEG